MNRETFAGKLQALTPKPRAVLLRVLAGQSDRAIAEVFNASTATVRKHIQNLCDHFDLQREADGQKRNRRADLIRLFAQYKPEIVSEQIAALSLDRRAVLLAPPAADPLGKAAPIHRDWGEAVDVGVFYGRKKELSELEQWLMQDRCRLVALLGMGGIGKTSLAVKLVDQLKDQFEYFVWRSLRNAPPIRDLLADLIQFLSDEQETEPDLAKNLSNRIARLLDYLRQHRCLLVLDNVETILRSGDRAGQYREGYEGYSELLRRVGEEVHDSCLLLTSREKPRELTTLGGKLRPVRTLKLVGLEEAEGQEILRAEGFSGSEDYWRNLIKLYSGSPLALKIVATTIQELFDGNIAEFLAQGTAVFGDIRDLLDQQLARLSDVEAEVMYWLAINREPVSLSQLKADILSPVLQPKLMEALESLGQRSLIEKSAASFTLQPVVMEYVTEQLIDQVCAEIQSGQLMLFNSHALLKAQAKDYVRDIQIRLILQPIFERLTILLGSKQGLEERLAKLLFLLRQQSCLTLGYAAGNILNLLCQLRTNLKGHDFSRLTVRQAYLKGANLHEVNFADANLMQSVFVELFGSILSVAFSPDGKLLATGDADGKIRLWKVADGRQLLICEGHTNWILSIAFSPDGHSLASGSYDRTIKLWEVSTGQCLQTFKDGISRVSSVAFSPDGQTLASGSDDKTVRLWQVDSGRCLKILGEHSKRVRSVAFSPDGQTLASGGDDKTVRLWQVDSGRCLKILGEHSKRVRSVAFSPDGQTLASSSDDQTVRLWQMSTGQCCQILRGHTQAVCSVAFSPDGHSLASSSNDQAVRLWDVRTGQCHKTLQGHNKRVWAVAFSPDQHSLASGSADHTIKLWNFSSGQCLQTLQGHSSGVWAVAFSPDGQTLASGSDDQAISLWQVSTGQRLQTLQGHSSGVWAVAFSPDGQTLASGSDDQAISLWQVSTGQRLQVLREHHDWVWSVAFSPDGKLLASGSDDQSVRLWQVSTGQCLQILQEHSDWVWSVAFSPDGQTLASGSVDRTVKLWEVSSGRCRQTLQGHKSRVCSVAFNPDGQTLASGSEDCRVKLWQVSTSRCLQTLQGHTERVGSVAFSPDGQVLASGSYDHSVKLWQASSGLCLRTLQGHSDWVRSVAFSPDGRILASGSQDETIKLWDVQTGECLNSLRTAGPYEGMNITGVIGLTETQKATLKALGAIETLPVRH